MRPLPGRGFFLGLSVFVALMCIVVLLTKGLNFGIDFTGGTLLERRFERPVTAAEVRTVLESPDLESLELSHAVVQPLEDPRNQIIRLRALAPDEVELIDAALRSAFGEGEALRTESVGPVVGAELVRKAIWALLLSFVGVLIYLSFRFEFSYGVVTLIAVMHDALFVLGLVALTQQELNTPFIAALLTVVGYSLNDSIIIFDRIRENMRLRKRESIAELVGHSVRQTLGRTVNTSVTTLFVMVALLVFGGSNLRGFALVLTVGIVVGTYSSIFLGSHLWAAWKEREESRRRAQGGVRLSAKQTG